MLVPGFDGAAGLADRYVPLRTERLNDLTAGEVGVDHVSGEPRRRRVVLVDFVGVDPGLAEERVLVVDRFPSPFV